MTSSSRSLQLQLQPPCMLCKGKSQNADLAASAFIVSEVMWWKPRRSPFEAFKEEFPCKPAL